MPFKQPSAMSPIRSSSNKKSGDPCATGVAGHCVAKPKTPGLHEIRGGVDTMLNALTSDQDLFVAELSLAQARLNELLSLLYGALGGGWQ